jgi:DNA-directed RNA polymerase subunit N (RpoN/RPB10)
MTNEEQQIEEKRCSSCGKVSWDNTFGSYNERHEDKTTGRSVKCDTNGGTYVDGVRQ